MRTQDFNNQVAHCKSHLRELLQSLHDDGISDDAIIVAMGSATGNLVGLMLNTDDDTKLRACLMQMTIPMLADAKSAYALAKAPKN